MVVTTPIVVPLVTVLAYDPVSFGILLILLVDMVLIISPEGFNLFAAQGAQRASSLG